MVFMANQSSVTLQNKFKYRPKEFNNIPTGLSKPFVNEENHLGFCFPKDSSRVLGSETTDINQDRKRRCLEVEDVNCALEVEVIDDTALIEATAAVKRFKNRYRKETDLGFGKKLGKEENGGKKQRNKGFKKPGKRCLMKCVNEKKISVQVVEDKNTYGKKIPEGKGKKGYRKMSAKGKYVYQKKDTKNPKVEDQSVIEKIVGEAIEESDVSLKVSVGDETESTVKLVETESGNENDDGLKLDPQIDVVNHAEVEDENVSSSTNVGSSKKTAYTIPEMEALRFVDELAQTAKWNEVYSGFSSDVVREYNGLLVDVSNGPPRYRRVVNCGYVRRDNPILGMPPVLPLCLPSNHRKFDREGVEVNSN